MVASDSSPLVGQGRMVTIATKLQMSKPAKVVVAGCLVFLVYLLYSYRKLEEEAVKGGGVGSGPGEGVGGGGAGSGVVEEPQVEVKRNQVVVDVFYEVLCPDSRYFVQHELMPAYSKLGDTLDVRLWPYGKATSQAGGHPASQPGDWVFQCQHGEEECRGNIWHACTARHINEQASRLKMVECMIDDNYDAQRVAESCAKEVGVNLEKVTACALGEEGRELHYLAGRESQELQPKVSFIPTIKLGGSQGSQKAILKNFLKEACKVYLEKFQETAEGCP